VKRMGKNLWQRSHEKKRVNGWERAMKTQICVLMTNSEIKSRRFGWRFIFRSVYFGKIRTLHYHFSLPNLQIIFLRAFSGVIVITWIVILQAARAARHFNTRRERVDCFVNFYLFTPTRRYVFRTIVQDTHEFIVRDVFYYLFTIWILTV